MTPGNLKASVDLIHKKLVNSFLLDSEVQFKILRSLYERWKEDFAHSVCLRTLNIEGVSEEDIIANAEYLASKEFIEEPESMQFWTSITPYGIDQVEDKRTSTDLKNRRKILEVLKGSYEKDPWGFVNRKDLAHFTGLSSNEILRNVWYLDKKGLAKANWTLGGLHSARISARGIDALKEPSELENELRIMSHAYSLLYLLENQLRLFIERKLREIHGDQWAKCIPDDIAKKAEKLKSSNGNLALGLLNYMQFGHLTLVIGKNWEIFKETFKNPTGVVGRLNELEEIRHKIAHCRMLSNDDLTKLELFHKEITGMILRSKL